MNNLYNKKLTSNSRQLRNNMTKEEKHLWFDFLKRLPINIHKQKVIGNYIVDFYVASCNVVIEVDGSQHYEESNKEKDIERDSYMNSHRIKVLRYSNYDVNYHFDRVCEDIRNNLGIRECD